MSESVLVRSLEARNRALTRKNEALETHIEVLNSRIAALESNMQILFPPEWRLTGKEQQILEYLLSRDAAHKQGIFDTLYFMEPSEQPEPKIVDVFVCKVRAKLRAAGADEWLVIETIWGRGYSVKNRHAVLERLRNGAPPMLEAAE